MAASEKGNLIFIDGILDQYGCKYSLQGKPQESAEKLDLGSFYRFQPDYDLKYIASVRKIYLLFCTPSVWKPDLYLRNLI